jgi:hypothetical protein
MRWKPPSQKVTKKGLAECEKDPEVVSHRAALFVPRGHRFQVHSKYRQVVDRSTVAQASLSIVKVLGGHRTAVE